MTYYFTTKSSHLFPTVYRLEPQYQKYVVHVNGRLGVCCKDSYGDN